MIVAAVCACMQVTSHPLLWTVLKFASMIGVVVAQAQLRRPALAFLRDHSVQGRPILPAAAMLEMAMAFGKVAFSVYISLPFAALYGQTDEPCTGNLQRHILAHRCVSKPYPWTQVLCGMGKVHNEVAVASGAMPAPFVLSSPGQPEAQSRVNLASGVAEVCLGTASSCCRCFTVQRSLRLTPKDTATHSVVLSEGA